MMICQKCGQYYEPKVNRECPYCSGVTGGLNLFDDDIFNKNIDTDLDEQNSLTGLDSEFGIPDYHPRGTEKVSNQNMDNHNKTVIYRPSSSKTSDDNDEDIEFFAGWLVIIDGPGKGKDLKIKYGQNSMGRLPSNSISIDFGDKTISREKHAFIIYDPKNKEFLFKNGDGQNLSYLNGKAVYTPTPIKDSDIIELGATKLKFVQLCSEDFSWE